MNGAETDALIKSVNSGNLDSYARLDKRVSSSEDLADAAPYARPHRGQSLFSAIGNLANTVLGAGALAFPFAFAGSGVGGGLFLTCSLVFLACFTLFILSQVSLEIQEQTYEGLLRVTLGKRVASFAGVVLLIYLLGVSVIYLQVIGDSLSLPIQYWAGVNGTALALHEKGLGPPVFVPFFADRRFLIAVASVVFVFPLAMLKTMKALGYVSTFGVVSVLYTVGFVTYEGISAVVERGGKLPVGTNPGFLNDITFASAVPVILLSYMCHVSALPIMAELKNPTKKRTLTVVIMSMVLCLIVYVLIGVFGYVRFGDATLSNVLNNFSGGVVGAVVGRFAMVFTTVTGYPMGSFQGRLTVNSMFFKGKEFSSLQYFAVTAAWVGVTAVGAMFIPSMGIVFSFVGAICATTFMLIVPGLLYKKKNKHSLFGPIIGWGLVIFGIGAAGLAVTTTILDILSGRLT